MLEVGETIWLASCRASSTAMARVCLDSFVAADASLVCSRSRSHSSQRRAADWNGVEKPPAAASRGPQARWPLLWLEVDLRLAVDLVNLSPSLGTRTGSRQA